MMKFKFHEQINLKQQNKKLRKKGKSKKSTLGHILTTTAETNIILGNNTSEHLSMEEQLNLFSEIIIDIYLQNEMHHEKRKHSNGS